MWKTAWKNGSTLSALQKESKKSSEVSFYCYLVIYSLLHWKGKAAGIFPLVQMSRPRASTRALPARGFLFNAEHGHLEPGLASSGGKPCRAHPAGQPQCQPGWAPPAKGGQGKEEAAEIHRMHSESHHKWDSFRAGIKTSAWRLVDRASLHFPRFSSPNSSQLYTPKAGSCHLNDGVYRDYITAPISPLLKSQHISHFFNSFGKVKLIISHMEKQV